MSMEESEREDEVKRLKATHAGIETALDEHVAGLGISGMITGWVLAAAITSFDDEGGEYDGLYQTQSDGLSKWTQIGMLTTALDSAKNEGFLGESDV